MGFEISNVHELMAKALDFRAIRQNIISSNIANADTPLYKSRDIRFENILKAQSTKLKISQTSPNHINNIDNSIETNIYFRNSSPSINGNNVDIDVETTQMSKNSIIFNALIKAIKMDTKIFRSVIDASARLR